jgi:N-methylhydantoinase A
VPTTDGFVVGVDIGGTFTDAVAVSPDGELFIGKVLTTPEDFSHGFFGAIAAAAGAAGLDERALLSSATRVSHGTTVGINALVTGAVAKVALLATSGHGGAIRAKGGEGRILGATLEEVLDYAASSQADPLVAPEQVYELSERVDRDGAVVVALSTAEVEEVIAGFEAAGIEAVAISLLWSFANPDHERAVAAVVRRLRPDLFVSTSLEVAPRIGEYGRTASTVMNAQIGPLMLGYIDRIVAGAAARGFRGEVLFGQAEGGLVPASEARRFPLVTLQSGPVANVMGSAVAGSQMGYRNLVVADMGGTTLDAALIDDGRVGYLEEAELVRQRVYLRKVDVESIGAGGGSIAWIDEGAGTLRVGPASAGAVPGPVCYGRGGRQPTVTDADLVLGILDPERPLASGMRLDREGAWRAMEQLGAVLGLDAQQCAAGVVAIVDSRMEDLLRRVTIQRGQDPRSLVLWASGGASGAHAGLFGPGIGVGEVVFPLGNVASVWSAYGLTLLDHLRTFQADAALSTPLDLARLAEVLDGLEVQATAYADEHGLVDAELLRRAEMKYPLQMYTVEVDLPPGEVGEKWADGLLDAFHEAYQRRFGPGTGYAEAGAAVTALRVTVQAAGVARPLAEHALRPAAATSAGQRDVYWGEVGEEIMTPLYWGPDLVPGAHVTGPAIAEFPNTTVVARPGQSLRLDGFGNLVLVLDADVEAGG